MSQDEAETGPNSIQNEDQANNPISGRDPLKSNKS